MNDVLKFAFVTRLPFFVVFIQGTILMFARKPGTPTELISPLKEYSSTKISLNHYEAKMWKNLLEAKGFLPKVE